MDNNGQEKYLLRQGLTINKGFQVNPVDIYNAIIETSDLLGSLPISLFRSIDYKATSGLIGSVFCDRLAPLVGAMVNPIEKGHPDIIPLRGRDATEQELRNYPQGLEIKNTIGNLATGTNITVGHSRIDHITGITWQAHHREVDSLLGLVWDFIDPNGDDDLLYPSITGVFYCENLTQDDWGTISGTTGRNTKVTGMTASGKRKMGCGWVVLLNNQRYISKYSRILNFNL